MGTNFQEVVEEVVEEVVVHEDNDWGISLVDEDAGESSSAPAQQQLAEGITTAYELPSSSIAADEEDFTADVGEEQSLEELMKQMKGM